MDNSSGVSNGPLFFPNLKRSVVEYTPDRAVESTIFSYDLSFKLIRVNGPVCVSLETPS